MQCWKCQKKISDETKVGFRLTCFFCGVDLHVCVNCRNYCPGKPNDCLVPGTEFVANREAMNFCEEFVLRAKPKESHQPNSDRLKKIFGEDIPKKKNPFS